MGSNPDCVSITLRSDNFPQPLPGECYHSTLKITTALSQVPTDRPFLNSLSFRVTQPLSIYHLKSSQRLALVKPTVDNRDLKHYRDGRFSTDDVYNEFHENVRRKQPSKFKWNPVEMPNVRRWLKETWWRCNGKGKVQFTLGQAMRAQKGSRGIALFPF